MNLSIQIKNTTFPNPVTVASGTFGLPECYPKGVSFKRLGAVVPKTVTRRAQEGNPAPRIVEAPSGMVNAIGIENSGIDDFIQNKLPRYQTIGPPVIVSILGHTDEDFVAMAEKLDAVDGLGGIECNLSCPNVGHHVLVAQDPQATARVVAFVRRVTKLPVIAKLSPNVTDIATIAQAAEDAGADAVSLVNTFSAMVIDAQTRQSKIGHFTGGLSGPAIRPMAVHRVYQAAQKVRIPIIGMGGIACADDALQFILAGASMVAVGTASFCSPSAPLDVLDGIQAYMKQHKLRDIKDLVGGVIK